MRSYKTEGIIIKRKDFGEADRILTVLTKNQGKISVVAKGVRKISSRRSPHVELLNLSILTIHDGKIPVLTEAETLRHFSILKNDLEKCGFAFYICELIDGLTAEYQESRVAFNLMQDVLTRLQTETKPQNLISKFEQDLLASLGFLPKTQLFIEDSDAFIEDIIERKIKSKRIIQLF